MRRGVTRLNRIAAEGGSNGGLLIANMLTRYPDRFGALLCTVPVIDMRALKLLMGVARIDDYGHPTSPTTRISGADVGLSRRDHPARPIRRSCL